MGKKGGPYSNCSTKWWMKKAISSLARSPPAHNLLPPPKGEKYTVFPHSYTKVVICKHKILFIFSLSHHRHYHWFLIDLSVLIRIYIYIYTNVLSKTCHRQGSNSSGFLYTFGSRCTAQNTGNTFHPLGIIKSKLKSKKKKTG